MKKIEITDIVSHGTYIEVSFIHTLIIPEVFKNDKQLMSKASKILHNFNAANYILEYIEVGGEPYIQSHRQVSFILPIERSEIEKATIEDYNLAQYILNNATVPEFYRAVNTEFDGSDWSDK